MIKVIARQVMVEKVKTHNSIEDYRILCGENPGIALFSQPWWLDAVAPGLWDAVIVAKKSQVIGALPYVCRKKLGFTLLTQPQLTQTLGPWVRPSKKSYAKALGYEKDVLQALADGLPAFDYYAQNWHPSMQNWLPFYWRGFEQTTRYTYQLHGLADKEALWKGLQQNIRGDIRKARDRFGVEIRPAESLNEFLTLNRMTFTRQGKALPYTRELVEQIDKAARARDACDCLIAVDAQGQKHAAAYIVRSGDTAYYLMGGGDPELRNSGATSLLLWEAIQRQPERIELFDFEGSMIEPVERFFRAFGAIQTPYLAVSKTNSRLLATYRALRRIWW